MNIIIGWMKLIIPMEFINIDGEIAVSALDPEWYLEENELAIGE